MYIYFSPQKGNVLILVCPVIYLVGLNYAPASIVVGIGSPLAVVFNVVNARVLLGEECTRRDYFGIILIFNGSVLSFVFGSHHQAGK